LLPSVPGSQKIIIKTELVFLIIIQKYHGPGVVLLLAVHSHQLDISTLYVLGAVLLYLLEEDYSYEEVI
jgi:hypothetical protein